MKINDGGCGF